MLGPATDWTNAEIRRLRYLLRQSNRNAGRMGDTIHRLRAELAEVRMLNSKLERGELRMLERRAAVQAQEIETLRRKLDESQ